MDAQVLEEILKDAEPEKKAREIEIKLIARLRRHLGNPKFTALGERLEKIKERHEQGFLTSLEFLKADPRNGQGGRRSRDGRPIRRRSATGPRKP